MVSMMRYVCLLLLVGAAVSIPLSPLTDLPPAYDDMLFNQLQGRLGETLVASAQVTKEYSRLATIEEVSAELSKYFPEVSSESVVYIHRAFSEINEHMIENHMVQSAQSEQQKSSSLLAQVLVSKQKIRLVMIKISHKSYQPNYMHLVYKSPYGTAPREFSALIGTLPACAHAPFHLL